MTCRLKLLFWLRCMFCNCGRVLAAMLPNYSVLELGLSLSRVISGSAPLLCLPHQFNANNFSISDIAFKQRTDESIVQPVLRKVHIMLNMNKRGQKSGPPDVNLPVTKYAQLTATSISTSVSLLLECFLMQPQFRSTQ